MKVARIVLSCWLVLAMFHAAVRAEEQYQLHKFEKLQLSDTFYCEGASFGDFNRDGVMDIVSGPYWYAGPTYANRHELYEPKVYDAGKFSDNFFAFPHDVNSDGWNDIVVVGFPGKEAWWFENPQDKPGHWPRHLILDVVDGESPTFTDITGDGKPELVCLHDGCLGLVEMPAGDLTKPWPFRPISEDRKYQRFTHGMGVGDVNQDGRIDVLQKEGWWEQPPAGTPKDALWKFHSVDFAMVRDARNHIGGAQMYVVDYDGDGDNDVLTSKNAHGFGLSWFENKGREADEIRFVEHSIMGEKPEENAYGVVISSLHALDISDLNHDGITDFVSGRRGGPASPCVLYWFETLREGGHVQFVPHRIDAASGVGTQVVVGDLNGDKLDDIVVGSKWGTFVFKHRVEKVDREQWERARPKPLASSASSSAAN
ncbi:MAG: VCBS repeat-containing protein [Pirellulales bacterium]|nr:VCBS repeat-containing protein [Pirellulales bacterium]